MNIELFSGQSCLVHVKLPEEWVVYGGTPKGEFKAERESSDSVLVTVPAMVADFTPLVPYELFARRIHDGKEWLVLSGQIRVRRRYSDAGGGVSAIEYFVEPKLEEDGITSSPQIIVGIPGPQGPKGDKGEPGEGGMTSEERATLAGAAQRGGDNTFTAANTFTGSVDMSTAQVTPPSGWNVGELTAEEVQAVVPIAFTNWTVAPEAKTAGDIVIGEGALAGGGQFPNVAIGKDAKAVSQTSVAIGFEATATSQAGTVVGSSANAGHWGVAVGCRASASKYGTSNGIYANSATYGVAVGYYAKAYTHTQAITIGSQFTETVNGQNVTNYCQTQGTGSITIGAGANTLNNGDVESSNSVTIGCKASNSGADSVVIGAGASNKRTNEKIGSAANASGAHCVIIGNLASANNSSVVLGFRSVASGTMATVCGYESHTAENSVAIGGWAKAQGKQSVALGRNSKVTESSTYSLAAGYAANAAAQYANAVGANATVSDLGATVIRSTAEDGTYTQLYFSGANTPLANTYHDGAPMLGYVTKDSAGNIVAAGTRSLIDLLTDNSTFAPASLDENGEWVTPKVFHPSDLDMPSEEPSEPEEYTPLPVWPIVEPDDIMGDNGTLEQGGPENTSPATNS